MMSYSNGIGDWKQVLPPVAPTSASQTQQVAERQKTAAGQTAAGAKADETKLSPAGELIANALSGSDVRTAKVEALQKAIAEGSYNVSSSDVAGKIMDSLLK
jgi:negative regulator of flagellin synthesis FlgM